MKFSSSTINYQATGAFSALVNGYLSGDENLTPFFTHQPSLSGIISAIEERKKYPTDRKALVAYLNEQYATMPADTIVSDNIQLLLQENTFTVCTAHQPNILTGNLYFVYKILHAIRLAKYLKNELPQYNFVPVYYMGNEDADLAELGELFIEGATYNWKTDQTGAVGKMVLDKSFIQLLKSIEGQLNVLPNGEEVMKLVKRWYTEGTTVEQATFGFVNALFGKYGLVVLMPDGAGLKEKFLPIVEKEIITGFSSEAVQQTVSAFPKQYNLQATGRPINLFYLQGNTRERVEVEGEELKIGSSQKLSKAELLQSFEEHPERISPNVVLRPLYQEMILPNVAFIGGGGEIAYWLQLKQVFSESSVPFPVLLLRNSFAILNEKSVELAKKFGFTDQDLFLKKQMMIDELVKRNSSVQLSLEKEKKVLAKQYELMKNAATQADTTLAAHVDALHKKAMDKIVQLEKKIFRAERKKMDSSLRQVVNLNEYLFPEGILQERKMNILPFISRYGLGFIDQLYQSSLGLEQQFTILKAEAHE